MNRAQPSRRIALFAADAVGVEVARVFRERNTPITALVLDKDDRGARNSDIMAAAVLTPEGRTWMYPELSDPRKFEQFRNLDLNLGFLAWWPYIIKQPLLGVPRRGYLNLHPSLLPFNRGKDPNFWALAESTPFGVTIHEVNDGVDSGNLAFQREIPVTWEDTGESLYRKACTAVVELVRDSFDTILAGNFATQPQSLDTGSFHRRCDLEPASEIKLDATYTGRELLNVLRARTFTPHPGAWFVENGERYEVRLQITPSPSR